MILQVGLNDVVYTGGDGLTPASVFGSTPIRDKIISVSQSYGGTWYIWSPTAPDWANTLTAMHTGMEYVVNCSAVVNKADVVPVSTTPPPVIASVDPIGASQNNSLYLVLRGSGFTGCYEISFSGTGITASPFTVDSDTQITIPISIDASAPSGTQTITIRTPGPTADGQTATIGFEIETMAVPSIASITPNGGYQGDLLDVVITGQNFVNTFSVNFGPDIYVSSFTVDSPERITAHVDIYLSASTTIRDVTVVTIGGTAIATGAFGVLSAVPSIVSISPMQAYPGDSLVVTLIGNTLQDIQSVDFGSGIELVRFAIISSQKITASINISEYATPGVGDVTLTTSQGYQATVGFTVLASLPSISYIDPSFAYPGDSLTILINGANFTDLQSVTIGTDINVLDFSIVNLQLIRVDITIPEGATLGTRDVTIGTSLGVITAKRAFSVVVTAPSQTSGFPWKWVLGGGVVVAALALLSRKK